MLICAIICPPLKYFLAEPLPRALQFVTLDFPLSKLGTWWTMHATLFYRSRSAEEEEEEEEEAKERNDLDHFLVKYVLQL